MEDKEQFLKDQLTKSPDDSKKAKMARAGLYGIAAFFLSGLLCMFIKPDTASHVVLLVQTAIGAWTFVIGAYLGAQGSVDYKTTQVLGNTIEKRDETRTEHIISEEHYFEEGAPGAPARRPWSKHEDEDAV
jgi:hypothetical protein